VRQNPARLADAGQPDPSRIDLGPRPQESHAGGDVAGELGEDFGAVSRADEHKRAGRFPDAPLVEPKDGKTQPRPLTREPGQIVAGDTPRAVSEHDGRERPGPGRQVEGERQLDVAVRERGGKRRGGRGMDGLSAAAAPERKQAGSDGERQAVSLSRHFVQLRYYIPAAANGA
jgi:hypothetical protein